MTSKRRLRRKECGKKRRFSTIDEAQDIANVAWARGIRIRAYACHWCNGFHVGHMPRRLREGFAKRNDGAV